MAERRRVQRYLNTVDPVNYLKLTLQPGFYLFLLHVTDYWYSICGHEVISALEMYECSLCRCVMLLLTMITMIIKSGKQYTITIQKIQRRIAAQSLKTEYLYLLWSHYRTTVSRCRQLNLSKQWRAVSKYIDSLQQVSAYTSDLPAIRDIVRRSGRSFGQHRSASSVCFGACCATTAWLPATGRSNFR